MITWQRYWDMVIIRLGMLRYQGFTTWKDLDTTYSPLGDNLYTLSLGNMMASSLICLMSKASNTKSWLWHRRLSHLNFGAINHLARHGLVRGLLKLKFEKDHLCSECTIDFNELTAMASEHSSSGPALHEMTPATISSGLVPNPPPSTPFVPPSRIIAPIDEVVAPVLAVSTGSRLSTTLDQDAPSPIAHMNNDPFFGITIPENDSEASFSDVISTVVQTAAPNSEHVTKWTKDHPLENIISELERPVSTRLQLYEQALFCYYDAFLTSVEPKNYKDALTQACWIEAMQEELHEFDHLEV
ncbi:integrase, catalytic region, zinc finger, CCHC-type containing protein [Tanacetum coccineum]